MQEVLSVKGQLPALLAHKCMEYTVNKFEESGGGCPM